MFRAEIRSSGPPLLGDERARQQNGGNEAVEVRAEQ